MELSRREVICLGAAGTLLSTSGLIHADGPAVSAIEEANAKLVTDFCESWSTLDVDKIASFLADKIIYQLIDNMPLIKGKEAFVKLTRPTLSKMERAHWEIKRTHCIGGLVINERIDNFHFKGNRPAAHFPVVGLFLVRDAKIQEWKDYRLPKQAEEPSPPK